MKNLIILLMTIYSSLFTMLSYSQSGISVNTTGAAADNSAILDISSTLQGLLIPRMTTLQRDAIASPSTSLLIFNVTTNCFEAYVNGTWYSVSCPPPCTTPTAPSPSTSSSTSSSIIWNWSTVNGATGYKWSTTDNYYNATDNGVNISYTQKVLTCNTSYTIYVWAYNACGNSIATTLTQATSDCTVGCSGIATVTDIDGNIYNTVSIGTQCWFKENLKTIKYNDGTIIPNVIKNSEWANLTIGAYCAYNYDVNNANIYGQLYNWFAVNDSRMLCPEGWHVPSHNEWTTLERTVCSSSTCNTDFPYDSSVNGFRGTDEGGKLKETGTTYWLSPNSGATNSIGFSGLPGGYRHIDASVLIGLYGMWWSSTGTSSSSAWARYLFYLGSDIYHNYPDKKYGFSVRCLKD
jgi:uncharacterized protein (TIGR02145 family)